MKQLDLRVALYVPKVYLDSSNKLCKINTSELDKVKEMFISKFGNCTVINSTGYYNNPLVGNVVEVPTDVMYTFLSKYAMINRLMEELEEMANIMKECLMQREIAIEVGNEMYIF